MCFARWCSRPPAEGPLPGGPGQRHGWGQHPSALRGQRLQHCLTTLLGEVLLKRRECSRRKRPRKMSLAILLKMKTEKKEQIALQAFVFGQNLRDRVKFGERDQWCQRHQQQIRTGQDASKRVPSPPRFGEVSSDANGQLTAAKSGSESRSRRPPPGKGPCRVCSRLL